jgi:hypothetical protein
MVWSNESWLFGLEKKAEELVASNNSPLKENGRRKGYIKLWKSCGIEKGVGKLDWPTKICEIKQRDWRKWEDMLLDKVAT